ncbi:MAG: hypothetical protein UY26_C0001G0007 [Candidatus Jorgensenbacteria bacterium GW2011_GWA1_48_13]|uniref:Uncharacterized protein n=2 Tax=Candidatus Joergenseniibacteriota TaxID=1752739 RepID=A0A0G1W915_9BACT|nr:MAG: hypothetical protein UY26_C0001G0007 [Candidatus Jorgensenbacteria bacterium GW2011_GWA1_48_13]KKU99368.1 MAG: hypothetical protein UY32_C0001G0003 [Candidatus Jorgensenbacteria bacterium GW2011_GWC1_48_8]KKW15253.1 MAG: hypothetical protein UY55_C0001G0007 [Candidatus Jorgensenbacteria bacterium GW2011_GWB1_50_10]
MKLKPNSNIAIFVVLLVVLGLVMAYVPLLFQPKTNAPNGLENPAPQNLDANLAPPETPAATTTEEVQNPAPAVPDGFSGLEEESQNLDDLLNQ